MLKHKTRQTTHGTSGKHRHKKVPHKQQYKRQINAIPQHSTAAFVTTIKNSSIPDDNQLHEPNNENVHVIDPTLIFGQQTYMYKSTTGMSVARYYTNVNAQKPRSYWDYDNYRIPYHLPTDYDTVAKLGRGKYSEVFTGFKNSVELPVVVKILKPVKKKKIRREVLALTNLRGCPYITTLIDVVKDPLNSTTILITKFAEGDDFKELFPRLSDNEVRVYMYQLLTALDHAHSHGIMHRDIKPQNIVIDQKNRVARVIDWGLAEFYHPNTEYNVRVASRYFKGPELLLNMKDYDYSLDIWSLGTTFAGMIFVVHPFFTGDDNIDMINKISRVVGSQDMLDYIEKYNIPVGHEERQNIGHYKKKAFSSFVNENNQHLAKKDAVDLLSKMLVVDHNERISAKEALSHPYFDPVRKHVDKQHEALKLELAQELERIAQAEERVGRHDLHHSDDNDDNPFA